MLHLVGAGPGNIKYLTIIAKEKIEESKNIVAFGRIGESISNLNSKVIKINRVDMLLEEVKRVEKLGEDITIVASGDPCFYGVLEYLKKQGIKDINVITGISSMQYLASKTNISHQDIKHISLHGRTLDNNLYKTIDEGRIFSFLTDKENTAYIIAKELTNNGFTGEFIVGYDLSYENEKIVRSNIKDVENIENPLACVIFIKEERLGNEKKSTPFKDEDFTREKVPMTKYEIRNSSINKLELDKESKLLEIGSGTGSLTIEALRQGASVTSIECIDEAYDLTIRNKEKLMPKACLNLIKGYAPMDLPVDGKYNRVFIGGSRGKLDEIFSYLDDHLDEDGVIVANFVTLDNLSQFKKLLKEYNYKNIDITLIQVSKEDRLGILRGENPVFIIKAHKGKNEDC